MIRYKIVETDNFGSDYPDEVFVNLPTTTCENANRICQAINAAFNPIGASDRWWKVVPEDYKLVPGFEL